MSYILDALRKAEQERHLGQPPSLTVAAPLTQPANQRLWVWLALGLGLGFNGALLAYFLLQPNSTTTAIAPSGPASTVLTPQPPVNASRLNPSANTETATIAPATSPTPTVTPLSATAPTQPVPNVPDSTPAVPPQTSASPSPTATPKAIPDSNPVVSKPAPAPKAADQDRRQRLSKSLSKPSASPTVTIGPEPPPLLNTLPPDLRGSLPALNLDIHVYSADPGKRFVVVNGRRYREGDSVEKSVVLESVTANGAILRQGGQRFRLSVGR